MNVHLLKILFFNIEEWISHFFFMFGALSIRFYDHSKLLTLSEKVLEVVSMILKNAMMFLKFSCNLKRVIGTPPQRTLSQHLKN